MKTTVYLLSSIWMIGVAPTVSATAPAAEDIGVLTKTAEQGDADAMFRLGRAFLMGKGVNEDTKRAFELMSTAAEKGHADAMGGVGYFHSEGIVVPKDAEEAARWFRKGAEKGSAKSRFNLGKFLLTNSQSTGSEAEARIVEGLRWIRMAADQGLPEAAYSYGLILYFGDHGQVKDYKLAAVYLKPAAEAGNPDAQNIMGTIHRFGQETPVDKEIARHWYLKAALQGHAKAQTALGMLDGLRVKDRKKSVEAMAWLLIASSQEEVAAIKILRDESPVLKPGVLDEAKKRAVELRSQIVKPAE